MKIAYLGTGVWGFALQTLLASKGYKVVAWTRDGNLASRLNEKKEHPLLPGVVVSGSLTYTTVLREALEGADAIIESVTSAGLRPVCEQIAQLKPKECPFVITSKGVEQDTCLPLAEVAAKILGDDWKPQIGYLSGPSYASEVVRGLPTAVTCSAYGYDAMMMIRELFHTNRFRVYPNTDIVGVAFGGALKNVIAIACGAAYGLELGASCRAALMTRGLHEIRKLAVANGARSETLSGLSGMGDLALTCSSVESRNFRFGTLLAQGLSMDEAKDEIGMVVEGAYTAVSVLQLSRQLKVPMPICEVVYRVLYEGMLPEDALTYLMEREVKEEHL